MTRLSDDQLEELRWGHLRQAISGYAAGSESNLPAFDAILDELVASRKTAKHLVAIEKVVEAARQTDDSFNELFLKLDSCPRCPDHMDTHHKSYREAHPQWAGCPTGCMLDDAYQANKSALAELDAIGQGGPS